MISSTDKPNKDKQGKTLMSTEDPQERWAEHFAYLLNRSITEDSPYKPQTALETNEVED